MSDLVGLFNLLAPFFGLILLGFVSAKRRLANSSIGFAEVSRKNRLGSAR